ncbi:MAG: TetR/AcrR family transcriptional regulator [Elusimicrobia bacterium]|nr:TetR/AcrR family transcriptional regulator [Elusimicrobiota bacterium]
MARPPSGTDLRLIESGKKLVREKGLYGLSVREACRLARVNTGMFHYYFGSKDEFVKRIVKDIYGEFFIKFKGGIASGADSRQKLKNAIVSVGKFARDARKVVPLFFADLIYGRKEVFELVKNNFTGHIAYIVELIEKCQKEGRLKKMPLPSAIAILIPPMIFPAVIGLVFERHKVASIMGLPLEKARDLILSDAAIDERVELLLKSLE